MQDIPITTPGMTTVERNEIYRYWHSRAPAERLAAGAELTRRKYRALGVDLTPPDRSSLVARKLTIEQWRISEEADLVP